jgi:enediyne biosynthesis protein E4
MSVADVNEDGMDDIFIGNAAGQPAALFIQLESDRFVHSSINTWKSDAKYEDIGSCFFDADGDGDPDLYVVSGSNEFSEGSEEFQDRLYLNDGKGNFKRNKEALPEMRTSGSCVTAADFDSDGDMDLFVGGKVIPNRYPYPPRSYLLENNNGVFSDITPDSLKNIGMVTDAEFVDMDGDGFPGLLLVGEWMPVTFFNNTSGQFENISHNLGIDKTNGWWWSITPADLDGDGNMDFICGNIGKNNKFKPTKEHPLHVYAYDFDQSGNIDIVLSKEKKNTQLPVRGKECSSQQMPFIGEKFPTYDAFANATLEDIYGAENLQKALHYKAYQFENIILMNKGNIRFEIQNMPNMVQAGPLMGAAVFDINWDGLPDLAGGGSLYGAEVETVSYDASIGFALLQQKGNTFSTPSPGESGIMANGNIKDVITLQLANQKTLVIFSMNNAKWQGYLLKGKKDIL